MLLIRLPLRHIKEKKLLQPLCEVQRRSTMRQDTKREHIHAACAELLDVLCRDAARRFKERSLVQTLFLEFRQRFADCRWRKIVKHHQQRIIWVIEMEISASTCSIHGLTQIAH